MEHHLRQLPLVVRREHPAHDGFIDRSLRSGDLVRVLPGVHRWKDVEETFELRAEAATKWQVNGILSGSTAARLTWWPELQDDTVRFICGARRKKMPWLVTSRQKVPDELVETQVGARLANTELSILQMCARGDAAAISEGLRREVVTLESLQGAFRMLRKRSKGNDIVRTLLHEARDEPWSPLELQAHQLLRSAGITGWRTNVAVVIDGKTYFADVLFHSERLIVEVDGRTFHSHADLDDDNERRNALIAEGWRVVHFSRATLPRMVPTIHPILKKARSAWQRDRLPPLPVGDSTDGPPGEEDWHVA